MALAAPQPSLLPPLFFWQIKHQPGRCRHPLPALPFPLLCPLRRCLVLATSSMAGAPNELRHARRSSTISAKWPNRSGTNAKERKRKQFCLTWHFVTTYMIHAQPEKRAGYLISREEEGGEKKRKRWWASVASSGLFESKNVNLKKIRGSLFRPLSLYRCFLSFKLVVQYSALP